LVDEAKERGMSVVIHGKAYKPDVPYCIGSYSTLIGHYVKEAGFNVRYLDPLADDPTEVVSELIGPCVLLLAHNRQVTYGYTGKDNVDKFYCDIPKGSVIVDPWRTLSDTTPDITVIHYGNTRNKK
jgi:hypothetical protein